jgi:Ca2+/Na+ antiporter
MSEEKQRITCLGLVGVLILNVLIGLIISFLIISYIFKVESNALIIVLGIIIAFYITSMKKRKLVKKV